MVWGAYSVLVIGVLGNSHGKLRAPATGPIVAPMNLAKLAALVRSERENLLSNWRRQVRALPSARHLDTPTLNDHIPGLLDELAAALESGRARTIPEELQDASAAGPWPPALEG